MRSAELDSLFDDEVDDDQQQDYPDSRKRRRSCTTSSSASSCGRSLRLTRHPRALRSPGLRNQNQNDKIFAMGTDIGLALRESYDSLCKVLEDTQRYFVPRGLKLLRGAVGCSGCLGTADQVGKKLVQILPDGALRRFAAHAIQCHTVTFTPELSFPAMLLYVPATVYVYDGLLTHSRSGEHMLFVTLFLWLGLSGASVLLLPKTLLCNVLVEALLSCCSGCSPAAAADRYRYV